MKFFDKEENSFNLNLTPVIDIVFLLIIFFLFVCNFIHTEDLSLNVPESCKSSENLKHDETSYVTLSLTKQENSVKYFVQSVPVKYEPGEILVKELVFNLDEELNTLSDTEKIVNLRIDRNIAFEKAKYALMAVAGSSATDIRISTLKIDSAE